MFHEFFKYLPNKKLETIEKVKGKMNEFENKLLNLVKEQTYLLQRLPKNQELFIKKLHIHFPLYLNWLVDNEIKQEQLKQSDIMR